MTPNPPAGSSSATYPLAISAEIPPDHPLQTAESLAALADALAAHGPAHCAHLLAALSAPGKTPLRQHHLSH